MPPVELDPRTLATRCTTNYEGALRDGTFTAHPKIDPETGEMLGFRYSAVQPYVIYYEISADGKVTREVPIDAPFPSMVHDFITTREHVIFPIFPATLRLERAATRRERARLGAGARLAHRRDAAKRRNRRRRLAADRPVLRLPPDERLRPKGVGSSRTSRATRAADSGRGAEDGDRRHGRDAPPLDARPRRAHGRRTRRATTDPASSRASTSGVPGSPYRYGFAGCSGGLGGGFSSVIRYDVQSGKSVGARLRCGLRGVGADLRAALRERAGRAGLRAHASCTAAETGRSDLAILDAENLDRAPLALAHLPHRVPAGFHGNWRRALERRGAPSKLRELSARRFRLALVLTRAVMAIYFGFILLVAFARPLLATAGRAGLCARHRCSARS